MRWLWPLGEVVISGRISTLLGKPADSPIFDRRANQIYPPVPGFNFPLKQSSANAINRNVRCSGIWARILPVALLSKQDQGGNPVFPPEIHCAAACPASATLNAGIVDLNITILDVLAPCTNIGI